MVASLVVIITHRDARQNILKFAPYLDIPPSLIYYLYYLYRLPFRLHYHERDFYRAGPVRTFRSAPLHTNTTHRLPRLAYIRVSATGLFACSSSCVVLMWVVCNVVMLYYDHAISLDDEVVYVWRPRKALSAYGFLLNRYLAFFGNIAVLTTNFLALSVEVSPCCCLVRLPLKCTIHDAAEVRPLVSCCGHCRSIDAVHVPHSCRSATLFHQLFMLATQATVCGELRTLHAARPLMLLPTQCSSRSASTRCTPATAACSCACSAAGLCCS